MCHHLVSTIPFYHAGEASDAIRKVMGTHYRADRATPFMWAFWKNQRACKFVEESVEGSGVYFYRNLHGVGEPPRDLTGGKAGEVAELIREKKETTATGGVAAASHAKRRLSHSAQMTAKALPILVAE